MSKPIPGSSYIIKAGDTLKSIAGKAYGDSTLSTRISKANQAITVTDILDLLPSGLSIIIPKLIEDEIIKTNVSKTRLLNKQKYDLTIIVNNIAINPLSARILRTMDTVSDGWTASIEWVIPEENKALYDALLPYKYPNAAVYIGNDLIINGYISDPTTSITDTGRIKNLKGFSFTIDLVDSTLKPPYEFNNITLEQHAQNLISYLGINVFFETSSNEPFDRITASPEDTIFSHLAKYAFQRGLLLSSTPSGDLLFTKSKIGASVGTISEAQQPLAVGFEASFDGRKRFNTYRAIGQSPGANAKPAIALDNKVPKSRYKTITVNDTTKGDIKKVADWKRSKAIVDALTIPFTVSDWYAPNGELWKENTLVTVISETIHVPQGFTFLIKSVEYIFEAGGQSAVLNLIPPQAYTGEEIIEDWR